jgi:hypothetical protein
VFLFQRRSSNQSLSIVDNRFESTPDEQFKLQFVNLNRADTNDDDDDADNGDDLGRFSRHRTCF